MKRAWFSAALLVGVVACSSSVDGNGGTAVAPGMEGAGGSAEGKWKSLFSSPSSPRVNATIYGLWAAEQRTIGGIKYDLRIKIEADRFTSALRCTMPDRTVLTVGIDNVSARVTERSIAVTESREAETVQGEFSCRLSVATGETDFQIVDGKLVNQDLKTGQSFAAIKVSD